MIFLIWLNSWQVHPIYLRLIDVVLVGSARRLASGPVDGAGCHCIAGKRTYTVLKLIRDFHSQAEFRNEHSDFGFTDNPTLKIIFLYCINWGYERAVWFTILWWRALFVVQIRITKQCRFIRHTAWIRCWATMSYFLQFAIRSVVELVFHSDVWYRQLHSR